MLWQRQIKWLARSRQISWYKVFAIHRKSPSPSSWAILALYIHYFLTIRYPTFMLPSSMCMTGNVIHTTCIEINKLQFDRLFEIRFYKKFSFWTPARNDIFEFPTENRLCSQAVGANIFPTFKYTVSRVTSVMTHCSACLFRAVKQRSPSSVPLDLMNNKGISLTNSWRPYIILKERLAFVTIRSQWHICNKIINLNHHGQLTPYGLHRSRSSMVQIMDFRLFGANTCLNPWWLFCLHIGLSVANL